jgi:hypothetical protein
LGEEVIRAFRRALDALTGDGDFSVTVPPMDGALNPDNRLEDATAIASAEAPDNLCLFGSKLLYSSAAEVFEVDAAANALAAKPYVAFASPVTALAARGEALAIALAEGGLLIRGGPHDDLRLDAVGGRALTCVTALAYADDQTILICLGSEKHPSEQWKHDLMERGASGSVWRVDLGSKAATPMARGLAFPFGVLPLSDGALVTESWRHRVVKLRPDFSPEPVLTDLPAYPARIAPSADGKGAWLALFAPRRQLTEFVLREPAYRKQMMQEIAPDHWVGPTLAPMKSFLEPLQGGTLKKLAAIKPWAPSRSYGLVARLDEHWQPRSSMHSRADGQRHGVMSTIEANGRLFATSRGAEAVIAVDLRGDE